MPANKLIYGQGREPKAFEFAIGEIVINVDDKRVFSKDKRNVVFELVGNFEDAPAYRTASISSRFASASLTGVMTASFNTDFLTGSNTSIFTQELEEGDVILITSASYESYHTILTVHNDHSASFTPIYISSDISGSDFVRTTVNLSNQLTASLGNYNLIVSGGTGIQITTGSEENSMIITATGESIAFVDAENIVGDLFALSDGNQQGQVTFDPNSIPAGGILSANTVNLSTIGTPTFTSVTTTDFVKTDRLSADQITSEGATNTKLVSLVTSSTGNPVITIFKNGGLGVNEVEVGTGTQTNETYLSVYGDVRVRRNITTNRTTVGDSYGYISASGLLYASASYDSIGDKKVVVYDESSGRFYVTGAYAGNLGDITIEGVNQNAYSTASILGSGAGPLIASNIVDNLIFEAGDNILITTGSGGNSILITASGTGLGGGDGYIGDVQTHTAGGELNMNSFDITNIDYLKFNSGALMYHLDFGSLDRLKIEHDGGDIRIEHQAGKSVDIKNYAANTFAGTDTGGHDSVLRVLNASDNIIKNAPLGKISFTSTIGGAYNSLTVGGGDVAAIRAKADDIFDNDGANPHGPTRLEFWVRPSSSADNELRMTLTPDSGTLFAGNVSASGILILSASDSVPAVEGGLMYSASNAFYLGFNDDISLAGFP